MGQNKMDISEQISSLLNSPDGMDKLRSAAASLLGNDSPPPTSALQENRPSAPDFPEGLLDNIGNVNTIMKIITLLQNNKADERVQLLLAIKPHLSKERASRVDKAVSLLKIATVIPILKEEGLMGDLLGGIL